MRFGNNSSRSVGVDAAILLITPDPTDWALVIVSVVAVVPIVAVVSVVAVVPIVAIVSVVPIVAVVSVVSVVPIVAVVAVVAVVPIVAVVVVATTATTVSVISAVPVSFRVILSAPRSRFRFVPEFSTINTIPIVSCQTKMAAGT
jgi:hypothetical protein